MPILVNKETGREQFFSQEELPHAVASGQFAPRQGDAVHLTDREGNAFAANAGDLDYFLDQGAAPEASASLERRGIDAELDREYGDGFVNTGRAFLEAAGRGVSFGGTDALLEWAGASAEGLRQRRERNPVASVTGEIAGALAPALLTGGASAEASGGRLAQILRATPAGLATRAGEAAAGALAAGEGAGLLARALPMAAQGVVEGGLFGAGQGVADLVLTDQPLTAETIVTTIGSNALLGAALGGAVGGAGKLASEAASEVAAVAGRRGGELLEKAEAAIAPASKEVKALRQTAREQLLHVDTVARESVTLAERALAAVPEAERAAFSESAARVKAASAAFEAELAGTAKGGAVRSAQQTIPGWQASDEVFGSALDGMLKRDPVAFKRGLTAAQELSTATQDLAERLRPYGSGEALAAPKLDAAVAKLGAAGASSAPKLHALDVLAAAELAGLTPDDLPVIGPAAGTLLKLYAAGRVFGLARGGGGLHGLEAMRSLLRGGGVSGAGRALLGTSGELAGGAMSKFSVTAAKTTGAVLKRIEDGVAAFAKATDTLARAAGPTASTVLANVRFGEHDEVPAQSRRAQAPRETSAPAAAFRDRAGELVKAIGSAPVIEQRIVARLVAAGAPPEVAQQSAAIATRGLTFLYEKMPKNPGMGSAVGVAFDRYRPSDADIAKWSRYVAAVESPTGVLDDMKAGRLTPEGAEALRVVYPEIYGRMQRQIVDHLSDLREDLPYAKRLQLSILFQIPVDSVMRPEFVAAMQAQFVTEEGTESGTRPPPAHLGSIKKPEATTAQRLAG